MKKIAGSVLLAIALFVFAGCAAKEKRVNRVWPDGRLADAGYAKKTTFVVGVDNPALLPSFSHSPSSQDYIRGPADGTELTWMDFSDNAPAVRINQDPINPAPIRLANNSYFYTSVQFAWDEERFYAFFYGNASSVEAFNEAKYGAHDSLIYESDCFELFIDPVGDGMRYIELQVSPYGVTADYLHTFSEKPTYPADKIDREFWSTHHVGSREWNAEGFKAEADIEYHNDAVVAWTCEMSVLWSDITGDKNHTPKVGDRVYVNALRYVWLDHEGRRILAPLMTGPTMHGCPHMTPMAMRSVVLTD